MERLEDRIEIGIGPAPFFPSLTHLRTISDRRPTVAAITVGLREKVAAAHPTNPTQWTTAGTLKYRPVVETGLRI
jgi:hypothetical protein